jgi:hypothetical protein
MQLLLWKVDRLRQDAKAAEELRTSAQDLAAVASGLPQQVKLAVADALEDQRREMLTMFAELERKIVRDIGQLQAELASAVSMDEMDERFQWLVEAVSDRFVALGNGLARIEREMAGG